MHPLVIAMLVLASIAPVVIGAAVWRAVRGPRRGRDGRGTDPRRYP